MAKALQRFEQLLTKHKSDADLSSYVMYAKSLLPNSEYSPAWEKVKEAAHADFEFDVDLLLLQGWHLQLCLWVG